METYYSIHRKRRKVDSKMNDIPLEEYQLSNDIADTELTKDEGWETVGTVKPQYELQESIVFSLRLPAKFVNEIISAANHHNMKPRTYARQALELGMSMENEASLDILATVFQRLVNTATDSGVIPANKPDPIKEKNTNTEDISTSKKKRAS